MQASVAILLTEWSSARPSAGTRPLCSSLLPLLGRPLLQRSLENLVWLGCKQIHVFLGDNPAPVRELLGDGLRWGVQLHYHYLQVDIDLPTNLSRLQLGDSSPCWLACDDLVPTPPSDVTGEIISYWTATGERRWAGLCRFSAASLAALQGCFDRQGLEGRLAALRGVQWLPVEQPLSCESDADFLRSARACLASSPNEVRIGRGTVIHPSAIVQGPVWVGHLVHVGPKVRLGPHAVVEDGAVVDQGAAVHDSLVLPDTYVGKELSLCHCLAAAGRLASVSQNVLLDELDPTLLTSVRHPQGSALPPLAQRLAIGLLRLALWPLWWWASRLWRSTRRVTPGAPMRLLRAGSGHRHVQTVRVADTLGALHAGEEGAWVRHFVHTFYPGLSAVQRGQLVLCGPELRDIDHVARLPAYWRHLYEQHPCGLLHPFMTDAPRQAAEDPYLLDVLTVADASLQLRLRLLRCYLNRISRDLFKFRLNPISHPIHQR